MTTETPALSANRVAFTAFIRTLQDDICAAFESVEPEVRFKTDVWNRPGGGGGISRVITDGQVWEKGGVNTSTVFGQLPEVMMKALKVDHADFFACGISLVMHPRNPHVPTVHANFRYFELYDAEGQVIDNWFGGGSDLTPYYLVEADARHFHTELKAACELFSPDLYPKYKKECDHYFVNFHRDNERRGIGGIFYDYLRENSVDFDRLAFSKANGAAFLKAYMPIVLAHKDDAFTEEERFWQGVRRGRYVEFNLVHDRGTLFGLKTNGRIESILMSLPPVAHWLSDYHPTEGSREAALMAVLKNPVDWV